MPYRLHETGDALSFTKIVIVSIVALLLLLPFGHFEKIDSGNCLESENPKQDGSMICF